MNEEKMRYKDIGIKKMGKTDWTDEFTNGPDGKILISKKDIPKLREKYKEKYGKYPPEPNKKDFVEYENF